MGLAFGMFCVDGLDGFGVSRVTGFCDGLDMFCVVGRFGMSLPAYDPCTFGGVRFCALGARALDAGFEYFGAAELIRSCGLCAEAGRLSLPA